MISAKFKCDKHKLFGVFVSILISMFSYGQRGVRIGYIDTEYILENISEYKSAQSQLDTKAQLWKSQIEQRIAILETQKSQLDNERVLLTHSLIEEREEELMLIENEILEYQLKRFGPRGDLMIQKTQLTQPLQDQIFAAVQEIATIKKYDFIFDKSADVVMLYSADRYDISEQVLRTINRSYNREQTKSKKERSAAKSEETIVIVDSDKDERQKLIDQRNAKRAEALAKRKAELEAKREARKIEIEEKKRKVKEARENSRAGKENKTSEKIEIATEIATETPIEVPNKETQLESPKILEKDAEIKQTKEVKISDVEQTKPLSEREARKKALEEKKKRILAERKAKLEALKRKRDSIRDNR